jgi:hypothetical protein
MYRERGEVLFLDEVLAPLTLSPVAKGQQKFVHIFKLFKDLQ